MIKIRLMGREVRVEVVLPEQLKVLAKEVEEGDVHAFYDPISYTIYMESTLTGETFRRVLLHELTHAMLSFTGVAHFLDEKQEEALCDLNENLLELFRDGEFVGIMNQTKDEGKL